MERILNVPSRSCRRSINIIIVASSVTLLLDHTGLNIGKKYPIEHLQLALHIHCFGRVILDRLLIHKTSESKYKQPLS